jgi:imidazolonepropionase-like amidohydrolase
MPRRIAGLVTLALVGCGPHPAELAIRNVRVIDGVASAPQDVLVRGGRIAAVGPHLRIPSRTQMVDGHGKYLIPGLWDMHVHLAALSDVPRAPEILLSYGVTGVRDMGGRLGELKSLRAGIAAGDIAGPRILLAGPTLNGKQAAAFHRVVAKPEDVPATVAELHQAGIDFLKVHNQASRDVFFALAEAAKAQGLSLVGHVPHGVGLAEASDAGMRSVEHIEVLPETVVYRDGSDPSLPAIEAAMARLASSEGDEIFRTFASNRTAYTPTLVAYRGFVDRFEDPERKPVVERFFAQLRALVPRMKAQGVVLLAGTDYRDKPGKSLHDELELLVQSGLTPAEALAAATVEPVRLLGLADRLGAVRPGLEADLVVLAGNPLADIRNTRRIAAVIRSGRLFDARQLAQLRKPVSEPS